MGSTTCCKNNTNTQVQIPQQFQNTIIYKSYQNFMNHYPNICHIINQSFEKGSFYLNKQKYFNQYTQFYLTDGIFIGNKSLTDGKKNGFGIMLFHQGKYYQGQWVDDLKCGHGLLIFQDGSYYFGSWKDDLAHGQGIHYSKTPKDFYNGYWQKGFRQGRGTQQFQDGSVYIGNFSKDMKNGKGRLIYPDKTLYQGQFIDDIINGTGIYKGKNHTYQGTWKNGQMHGSGKSQWKNQHGAVTAKYIGEYCDGIKQGFGEYTDSKGVTYKATWLNGKINQRGPVIKQRLN